MPRYRCLGLRALTTCLLAVTLPGCFAVENLDRFHPSSNAAAAGVDNPANADSLQVTLVNMGVHLQELIELRVINSSNAIASRIVIQPLDMAGSQRMTINVPNALPPGDQFQPYRLDFYGDHNHSGGYDGVGNVLTQDHAWRIEPLQDFPAGTFVHVANLVQVNFLHNTQFTDIDKWPTGGAVNPATDTGLSARIHFNAASMAQYKGFLIQARIEESRSGHTVAVYRNPQIPGADFDAILLGVLDEKFDYFIKVYIDANGNSQYDNPAAGTANSDLGFSIPIRSGDGSSSMTDGGSEAGEGGDGAASGDDAGATSGPVYGIDTEFNLSTVVVSSSEDVGAP